MPYPQLKFILPHMLTWDTNYNQSILTWQGFVPKLARETNGHMSKAYQSDDFEFISWFEFVS